MEETFPMMAPDRTVSRFEIHETAEEKNFVEERLAVEQDIVDAAETAGETRAREEQEGGFFSRTLSAVMDVFSAVRQGVLSPQTETLLGDVLDLTNVLLRDEQLSALDALAALRLLAGFKSNGHIAKREPLMDFTIVRSIFYYWQFAEAAFGWAYVVALKFERGFSGLAQGLSDSNDIVLQRYCKLQKEDILYTYWGESAEHSLPGHFVVRDERSRSIIWAIRGTFGVRDVITDLVAGSTPFLNGVAHKGMVLCVDRLMEKTWPVVQEALRNNPEFGLVLVGHSLGGAVASMLAMTIRANLNPDFEIACWAFACPPCVSLELAESTRSYIYGVAFGDDVIVRLSFDSLTALRRRLFIIANEGQSGVWHAWTEGLAASSQVEARLVAGGHISDDLSKWTCEADAKPNRLWAPSRQLYLYRLGSEIFADECRSTDFHSVIVSNNCFHDHLPTTYNAALTQLLARMKEREEIPAEVEELPFFDGDVEIVGIADSATLGVDDDILAPPGF